LIDRKRIAIVHDWLVTNAGAEKALKELVALYPDSDIFSLVDFLTPKDREEIIRGKSVHTTFIQKLPLANRHFRNYLPLFPKAIESLDLTEYDVILSSSWAVAKGVVRREGQLHICYCYTPIRYAWDLYDEYVSNLLQPKKFIVEKSLKKIREWDIESLDRVDHFIAISKFIQERIARLYSRDSTLIYPPVDTEKFKFCESKGEFYLTASRMVPYKKVGLIVEAFNRMSSKKLVVIGAGEELKKIKGIAKSNVTILGYQDDEVLVEYMQRAKGFVYGAIEDFGIAPIEAMACGTPVIALNFGGTKETVIDGVTGVHFGSQSAESIIEAVERFDRIYKNFSFDEIRKHSLRFSKELFRSSIKGYIESTVDDWFGDREHRI
jgi:glycosyltransferase involved in cell wall biosynthesis